MKQQESIGAGFGGEIMSDLIVCTARAKGHTGTHRLQLVETDWKLTPATPAAPQLVFIAVREDATSMR